MNQVLEIRLHWQKVLIQDIIPKCYKDSKHNLIKEFMILKQTDIDTS